MTFLAPGWLAVAAAAAAIVFGLHLFTHVRPRRQVLPTARFVPDVPLSTPSRAARPSDVLLLLLRVLALLLIGTALARPSLSSGRKPVATILVWDEESPVGDVHAFAERFPLMEADTTISMSGLSEGLIAARRAGAVWSGRADSIELVILSSLASGLWDHATGDIRATWPGRIWLDTMRRRPADPWRIELSGAESDWMRVAISRLGREVASATKRRVEQERWVTLRLLAPDAHDTATAVYAGDVALVGPVRRGPSPAGDPIAWFADGSVAAAERDAPESPSDAGCQRDVAFSLAAGDEALRSAGLRIVERLMAPCGAGWTPEKYEPLDSARIALLAGTGRLAASDDLKGDAARPPAWLPLLLALGVLVAERRLRQRPAE